MKVDDHKRAWATIDLGALNANVARVRQLNPSAEITAVIKADAYGHGMKEVATALASDASTASTKSTVDCFALATMEEVVSLNMLGLSTRLLLLSGFRDETELQFLIEAGIEFVVHADYQIALLKKALLNGSVSQKLVVWLKIDTGMNRLGMSTEEFRQAFTFLHGREEIDSLVIMSHLACADQPDNEQHRAMTESQLTRFRQIVSELDSGSDPKVKMSLAASAGILSWPGTHFDIIRPGIMLYGGSPFANRYGPELGLRPVMTLSSRLIAIKDVAAGDSIGYGATYTCEKNTRVGVVSIGYGDGYPRAASNGTPVLVEDNGRFKKTRLIGRVSMDMITIDLSEFADVNVGDEVVLWGDELPADEVAEFVGTISYELFCQVTERVHFVYN